MNGLLIGLFVFMGASAHGVLAGGRPNAISMGQNGFAGVVNPANAVWIEDRFDVGAFLVNQHLRLNNQNNNALFPPGKTDLNYKAHWLLTGDFAIHKKFQVRTTECSLSLASYTTPSHLKLRTKYPFPGAGTTPIYVHDQIQVLSGIFSLKLNPHHSIGFSIDYFHCLHRRNGFQRSDTPIRSVSPGHVTNNGLDHSNGFGLSFGWRWNITKALAFGAAFVKKSFVGQFRKYRGYEPHHGKNYIPETVGAGFTYQFNAQIAGRLELLWSDLGNLPGANNNVLPNGKLNHHKRGSRKSPGPGLQDATYINLGIGYKMNEILAVGAGLSHRIKLPRKSSNILSHTYILQTIYDILSIGANIRYQKHDLFFSFSWGIKNRESGFLPNEIGGGKLSCEKSNASLSLAWGYIF